MADEKEWMARAIRKLNVAVHEVVPPVGLIEPETARGSGKSEILHGHLEGKRAETDGQRNDRSEQSEVNGSFPSSWGSKKLYL